MSHLVYLALGSNLNDPVQQLCQANRAIAALADVIYVASSPMYRNSPLDASAQPDYVNQVVAISTRHDPFDLLQALQTIEIQQGRQRSAKRWAARTIDIDILLYDDLIIDTPTLTLPHPGLTSRVFVVLPLLVIAPTLCLPQGGYLADYRDQFTEDSLYELP